MEAVSAPPRSPSAFCTNAMTSLSLAAITCLLVPIVGPPLVPSAFAMCTLATGGPCSARPLRGLRASDAPGPRRPSVAPRGAGLLLASRVGGGWGKEPRSDGALSARAARRPPSGVRGAARLARGDREEPWRLLPPAHALPALSCAGGWPAAGRRQGRYELGRDRSAASPVADAGARLLARAAPA